jgi:error-prone DNA polymerase
MPQPLAQRRYAELHCRTNYSFLEGASHPDELVARAAELELAALAVTDRNSLAGVVRAHVAAKEAKLKLLIGAEITPVDAPPVVLWAMNRAGYGRLCRLITRGRQQAPKGESRITLADVVEHAEGLLAGVVLLGRRHAPRDEPNVLTTSFTNSTSIEHSARHAERDGDVPKLRDAFGDRVYALAELHRGPHDRQQLAEWRQLTQRLNVPLVAANAVHCHVAERQRLQDVLAAIRHGCSVAELGERRFSNSERHLKSAAEMAKLFVESPEAIARTLEIADRCHFSLDELRYDYPEELCPPGLTPIQHLTNLTWQGAKNRYPRGVPDKIRHLVEHELTLIGELHYAPYFLTVWDLVRFARSRDILCQGRGSAANSAVCFCLGVTSVDPERIDVLFERFISKERNEAPDIDVDFEHERREEVLQYLYEKYGRDRAAMTAEVISYRPRSAVRDVGKALGLSLDRVDVLAKQVDHLHDRAKLEARFREVGFPPESRLGTQLMELVEEILEFPRHLSQHVGGMVLTNGPLCELVPIENATMPGRTVIEWDKNDLDALGILKVDCLSLGMLTAIRKCFDLIEETRNVSEGERSKSPGIESDHESERVSVRLGHSTTDQPDASAFRLIKSSDRARSPSLSHQVGGPQDKLTLASIPPNDRRVYEMISRADTMGVFQIESRAQMSMLPRLKPRCFYDLVIEVAIVRPGPIQGDMVHPYLRRRCGEEPVEYPDDRIRAVLEKTLGVPIFQEQAMRLAIVAAGFTPGEADQLRRAMGAWRRCGVIDQFHVKLVNGMTANGYSAEFADRVFRQLRGFGEYGFPESHAASFALLVYVSAWLKYHHPAAFTAALLNSQPMGFYAPAQLVGDARKHGVTVRPVDVNFSEWDCVLEPIMDREKAKPTRSVSKGERFTRLEIETDLEPERVSVRFGHRTTNQPDASTFRLTNASDVERSPSPTLRVRQPSHALRLGFRMLSGFSAAHAERIVQQRRSRPFDSLDDFARRSGLSNSVLTRLSQADVFASLRLDRRSALWQSLPDHSPSPLLKTQPIADEPTVSLPKLEAFGEVVADYRTTGLSLRAHPLKFLRPQLDTRRITPASRLASTGNGRFLRVAGLVLLRQRPSTARGITFVTLEDESGTINLIVRPDVWERHHQAARSATVLLAHGILQRHDANIHVLVNRLEDLSHELAQIETSSRDFR